MDYITVRGAAVKWDISPRRVQRLHAQDRILGVLCFWKIMDANDAQEPADPRKNSPKGVIAYENEP